MAWKRGAAIVLFVLGVVLLIPGSVVLALRDSSSSTATAHVIAGAVLLGFGVLLLVIAVVICIKLPSSEKGACNCFTMRSKNSADTRIPREVTLHEKIYFGDSDRKQLEKNGGTVATTASTNNNQQVNTNAIYSTPLTRGRTRRTDTAIPSVDSGVVAIFPDQEPQAESAQARRISRNNALSSVETSDLPPGVCLAPGERVISVTKTVQEPKVRRVNEAVTEVTAPVILDAHQLHQTEARTVFLDSDLDPVTLPEVSGPVVLAGPSGYQGQSTRLTERSVQHEQQRTVYSRPAGEVYRPRQARDQPGYRGRQHQGAYRQPMREATVISESEGVAGGTGGIGGAAVYDVPRSHPVPLTEKERLARQLEGGIEHPPSYDETVYHDIRYVQ